VKRIPVILVAVLVVASFPVSGVQDVTNSDETLFQKEVDTVPPKDASLEELSAISRSYAPDGPPEGETTNESDAETNSATTNQTNSSAIGASALDAVPLSLEDRLIKEVDKYIDFQISDSEYSYDVDAFSNGDVVMLGTPHPFSRNGHFKLIRVNYEGEVEWRIDTKQDLGMTIPTAVTTINGDVVVAGTTKVGGNGMDVHVLRLDGDGSGILWNRTQGDPPRPPWFNDARIDVSLLLEILPRRAPQTHPNSLKQQRTQLHMTRGQVPLKAVGLDPTLK